MNYRKNSTTVYSVAKHAGVSATTASRVLSGSDYPVSAGTKDKVLASASDLGYYAGKGAGKNNRGAVAVIIPNLINPFYNSLIMGLEYSLRISGMSTVLMNTDGSLELEKNFIKGILKNRISGVIISPVGDDCEHLRDLEKQGVIVVVIEQAPSIDCNKISFNYRGGGIEATQYLISRGCKSIGFICSPLTKHSRREVYAGYVTALESKGVVIDEKYIYISKEERPSLNNIVENHAFNNGLLSVQAMIDRNSLPEALFCGNDITAFGVMQGLQKNGVRIPQDVSVIGFDNTSFSAMVYPRLTTIDQSTYEMGNMAAEILAGRLEDEYRRNICVTLEPRLIIRDSTINSD